MSKNINVGLIGNPNTGKTSVFNQLTGLNQKVGNYPGITVEKKEGICKLPRGTKAHILDLPGTYSLNTTSADESVVAEILMDNTNKDYPDVAVVVCDVENLKRNLLLFTQIKDLQIPTILVINMSDRMSRKGIILDIPLMEEKLNTKVALVSTRKKEGIERLKELIHNYKERSDEPSIDCRLIEPAYFSHLEKLFPDYEAYKLWLLVTQDVNFSPLTKKDPSEFDNLKSKSKADLKRLQHKETVLRYQFINGTLKESYKIDFRNAKGPRADLDKILTHKIWGYVIFIAILMLIFQAIYEWSGYPMDLIDESFAAMAEWTSNNLPPGILTDLLAEGIIAGIGGVVIFIPQIAFLFLFMALLEESGYMSRVVFLMDRVMRPFGLTGKSVVPLMSGTACAIPAIMAARTTDSWEQRLITILVLAFTTCSARLPVYLILIALVIPEGAILGFSYQALTLMSLYLIGFAASVLSAMVLNKFLKIKGKSIFMVEMPVYRWPLFKNVLYTVVEKTKSFVLGAGKIILAISIVLWFLGSYGFTKEFYNAEEIVTNRIEEEGFTPFTKTFIVKNLNSEESGEREAIDLNFDLKSTRQLIKDENEDLYNTAVEQEIASFKLENSFIGYAGKAIEPIVAPLGYDWKIGIGVITSFAAREVFVGTLATIYSVGSDEEETIKNRMAAEVRPNGKPVFNLATGISLMLFYAFAMQCMSTLAIVKRETNSWKWPAYQLISMSIIAYLMALVAYQTLK